MFAFKPSGPGHLMFVTVGLCWVVLGFSHSTSAEQATAHTPLTEAQRALALSKFTDPFSEETVALNLAPGEGMEYKYRIEKGGALLFSWTATAPVHFELHSEPDGAPRGFAETFDKHDTTASAHGAFEADFPGIHGWYWENRTDRPVVVTLKTAGAYRESREFRRGMDVKIKQFPR